MNNCSNVDKKQCENCPNRDNCYGNYEDEDINLIKNKFRLIIYQNILSCNFPKTVSNTIPIIPITNIPTTVVPGSNKLLAVKII